MPKVRAAAQHRRPAGLAKLHTPSLNEQKRDASYTPRHNTFYRDDRKYDYSLRLSTTPSVAPLHDSRHDTPSLVFRRHFPYSSPDRRRLSNHVQRVLIGSIVYVSSTTDDLSRRSHYDTRLMPSKRRSYVGRSPMRAVRIHNRKALRFRGEIKT